ncbi:unnamed protein product, partial [marine sediment metagenome]
YVRELVRSANAAGEVAGMVALSCPREVYRFLAHAGLPVVVFGSLYADQLDIASVDVDNYETGRLLTEHLLRSGHRRMALLCKSQGRPGDNEFFDGVSEVLTAAGLPHNSLIVRIVPPDEQAFAAQLRLLAEMPDRPTALIVRSGLFVRAAESAVSSLGLSAAERMEIVYQDHPPAKGKPLPYTCVRPKLHFHEITALIGKMLQRLSQGEPLEQQRVVVPVELRI